MQAPPICDHQTANYKLTIQDTTNAELQPLIRQSIYTGSSRSDVMEMITSGLQINCNYTLIISIVEEEFEVEVSTANFSTSF